MSKLEEALRIMVDVFNVAEIDPLQAFIAIERARAVLVDAAQRRALQALLADDCLTLKEPNP